MKGAKWTETDIDILKTSYKKLRPEEILEMLNRTYNAIITKAFELGITSKNINNSRINKETKLCTVCKKELPRTHEYFTSFISKRDGEVFQSKCRPCEKYTSKLEIQHSIIRLKAFSETSLLTKKELKMGAI